METISKRIGKYVRSRGYNLADVSRKTGVNYDALQGSLFGRRGELRASELIPLCIFLEVDPRKFADQEEVQEEVSAR